MWFGHLNGHETLSTTILHGTVEGARRRGRQKKSWLDNKQWTGKPLIVHYQPYSRLLGREKSGDGLQAKLPADPPNVR